MAQYSILYWQEIPSMVEATDGTTTHKEQLGRRFQELIDLLAMKRGLAGTDAYLDGFHRGTPAQREGAPKAVAQAVRDELEGEYDNIRAAALKRSIY